MLTVIPAGGENPETVPVSPGEALKEPAELQNVSVSADDPAVTVTSETSGWVKNILRLSAIRSPSCDLRPERSHLRWHQGDPDYECHPSSGAGPRSSRRRASIASRPGSSR